MYSQILHTSAGFFIVSAQSRNCRCKSMCIYVGKSICVWVDVFLAQFTPGSSVLERGRQGGVILMLKQWV